MKLASKLRHEPTPTTSSTIVVSDTVTVVLGEGAVEGGDVVVDKEIPALGGSGTSPLIEVGRPTMAAPASRPSTTTKGVNQCNAFTRPEVTANKGSDERFRYKPMLCSTRPPGIDPNNYDRARFERTRTALRGSRRGCASARLECLVVVSHHTSSMGNVAGSGQHLLWGRNRRRSRPIETKFSTPITEPNVK